MYKFFLICNNKNIQKNQTKQGGNQMKATGVVRRIDDLGRDKKNFKNKRR